MFKVFNVILAFFLLGIFFVSGQNITQTFKVASMTALVNLKPQPIEYLWQVNNGQAPIETNKIRCYADLYEHMLQVFPDLWEAYSVLGYCYHYLGNDAKAIEYLKTAIAHEPLYAWNYYNLATIYLNEGRYDEALAVYEELQTTIPKDTLRIIFNSQWVYLPLVEVGGKDALALSAQHLKRFYRGSFAIMELLQQRENNKGVDEMLKKIKMELHAF
jgi:tetratricopeptide (TPR) repeat protein